MGADTFDQSNPDIGVQKSGVLGVAFISQVNAGSGKDHAITYFDAFGNPGGRVSVINFPAGGQTGLVAAGLSNGKLLTAGQNDAAPNDSGGTSIAVGAPNTPNILPNPDNPILMGDQPDNQYAPDAAGLSGDRRVIVWADQANGSFTDIDIRMAVQNNAGDQTIKNAVLVTGAAGARRAPSVAAISEGFGVTWSDDAPGSANTRIMAQRYDQDGEKIGGAIVVDNVGDNDFSTVVGLEDGGFAVAYEDTQYGAGKDVSLRIYNADGTARTNAFRVNNTVLGDDVEPVIAELANGFLSVSWSHEVAAGDHNLYLRYFNSLTGDAITGETIYQSGALDEKQSVIASTPDGRTILAWNDSEVTDGGGTHIGLLQLALRDVTLGDGTGETIVGSSIQDDISGLGGDDTMSGQADADILKGGAGDDSLRGGLHRDILDGEGGNDTANYNDKLDPVILTLNGAFDSIVKVGGVDEDTIRSIENLLGGASSDTLTADALDNLIQGRGGVETLDGAGGFDTASYTDSFSALVVFLDGANQTVVTLGGVASDKIKIFENVVGTVQGDTIVGDSANNFLRGGAGTDYLHVRATGDGIMKSDGGINMLWGDEGNDGLFGGDGLDTLEGGVGDDGIVGGGGNDVMNGGDGIDFLFGGAFGAGGVQLANSGADTLSGGADKDGLYGFDGGDTLNGDAGDDYIEGGAGVDTLNGRGGADFLLGQDGNDTISGGVGFDYMYGGAQADTFIFRKGDSADWILDFKAADGDKLKFEGFGFDSFGAIPLVDLSSPGNPAVGLTLFNESTSEFDQLTVFGVSLAQLNAGNVLVA